jgi:hypothetical protein
MAAHFIHRRYPSVIYLLYHRPHKSRVIVAQIIVSAPILRIRDHFLIVIATQTNSATIAGKTRRTQVAVDR